MYSSIRAENLKDTTTDITGDNGEKSTARGSVTVEGYPALRYIRRLFCFFLTDSGNYVYEHMIEGNNSAFNTTQIQVPPSPD